MQTATVRLATCIVLMLVLLFAFPRLRGGVPINKLTITEASISSLQLHEEDHMGSREESGRSIGILQDQKLHKQQQQQQQAQEQEDPKYQNLLHRQQQQQQAQQQQDPKKQNIHIQQQQQQAQQQQDPNNQNLHRQQQQQQAQQQQDPKNQEQNDCHPDIVAQKSWSQPNVPDSLQNIQQNDTKLSKHICKKWILPRFTGPLNLANPNKTHYSQDNQSLFVDEILGHKRNGFFIESGAAGGEVLSNSLFFEKSRNWTGLLVEANPHNFKSLLKKNRHAYMVNACLSPTTQPMSMSFQMAGFTGGLTNYMEDEHKERLEEHHPGSEIVKVQCFPLFSILQALGISHVDYFSLDIEGAEMEVLRTLPLNKISVDVFSIEYQISHGRKATVAKLAEIESYLVTKNGYEVVRVGVGGDVILMKGNLV